MIVVDDSWGGIHIPYATHKAPPLLYQKNKHQHKNNKHQILTTCHSGIVTDAHTHEHDGTARHTRYTGFCALAFESLNAHHMYTWIVSRPAKECTAAAGQQHHMTHQLYIMTHQLYMITHQSYIITPVVYHAKKTHTAATVQDCLYGQHTQSHIHSIHTQQQQYKTTAINNNTHTPPPPPHTHLRG